jgi:VWA domain-containing protein
VSAPAWTVVAAGVATVVTLLLLRRRTPAKLPLADAASLQGSARRSSALRLALVVPLAAVLALLAVQARGGTGSRPLLPSGSAAIVVVDVSSSTHAAAKSISRVLQGLTKDPRRRVGLVVFSNAAYVALPPSTPADALKGWSDRFARNAPGTNPWASFSGGTAISSGLVLARRLVRRDHVVHPHVVLISDLVDTESDVPRLQEVVARYQREAIDLKIVKLGRGSSRQAPNLAFVERAASATVEPAPTGGGDARLILLAALVGTAALVATVHELAFHPFRWRAAT